MPTKAVQMLRDSEGKLTYHPAPSVPRIEPVVGFDHLNDVELVVVLPDVCLIEHAVVVFVHLARQQTLANITKAENSTEATCSLPQQMLTASSVHPPSSSL